MCTGTENFNSSKPASEFDENKCLQVLRQFRWGAQVKCLRCGNSQLAVLRSWKIKPIKKYSCFKCKYQFSDISGSIFHKTRVSLSKWFYAICLMKNGNGYTVHAFKDRLKVTYKTAWRIRNVIIINDPMTEQLYEEIKKCLNIDSFV